MQVTTANSNAGDTDAGHGALAAWTASQKKLSRISPAQKKRKAARSEEAEAEEEEESE
jgi:hypothetical protein